MAQKIYINGQYYSKEDAKISVYDHGLLYGDGVFEGIRAYNGKVFKLDEHVRRLYASARSIHLAIPLSPGDMAAAIVDAVAVNKLPDCYIRLVVTRGVGPLGLDIKQCHQPQVIIIVDKLQLYPEELYEKGLEIITASTIRNHPAACNPRVKSLNYLNNVLARIEGSLAGCAEVLMLNHQGNVAECSADNLFLVRCGEMLTPSLDGSILEGITRNTVMDLAKKAGHAVKETTLQRHDVYTAEEMFLTGTGAELIPVVKVDGRPIGTGKPGPVFLNLRKMFHELVRS